MFPHGCIVHLCHYIQVTQPKQCLSRLQQKTLLSLLLVKSKRMEWFSPLLGGKKYLFRHLCPLANLGSNKEGTSLSACPYIQLLLHCSYYRWRWPSPRAGTLASAWQCLRAAPVRPIRPLRFTAFGEVPYALLPSSQFRCPNYFIFHVQKKYFEISVVDTFSRRHHCINFCLLKTELPYVQ